MTHWPYTLAASLLSIAFPVFFQQQPGFRIAGQVVDYLSNRPIRGASVSVSPMGVANRQLSSITGQNGEFSFSGLPAGKYSLAVIDHGSTQLYRQTGPYATAIIVGPGLDSEHIVFPLHSPATISGTVVDNVGDPVRGAMVHLFGQSVENGLRQTGQKGTVFTGTDGTFRSSGIFHPELTTSQSADAPGTHKTARFRACLYLQVRRLLLHPRN